VIGRAAITIPGGRFWPPRRAGRLLVLRDVDRGPDGKPQPTVYRIHAASFLIVSERDLNTASTATVHALVQTPHIPTPAPACGSTTPTIV
jgi:hypothetical protein